MSRYVAESITTDAGRFGHVGLCQLRTKQFCTQLTKAYHGVRKYHIQQNILWGKHICKFCRQIVICKYFLPWTFCISQATHFSVNSIVLMSTNAAVNEVANKIMDNDTGPREKEMLDYKG